MDPGGMGGYIPPNGPKIHAQSVKKESEMLKIMHYPLPLEISGSIPEYTLVVYLYGSSEVAYVAILIVHFL